jgi:hypothetical protein
MVAGEGTVFLPPGSLYRTNIKVCYGPECARASFIRGGMDLKIEYRRPFDGHTAKYCVLDKNTFRYSVY